jgi:alkylhydroperoxidase/carboxymuconolactone decarboxylase family protein YurZ
MTAHGPTGKTNDTTSYRGDDIQGLRVRRQVLGDAYVDESLKNADSFTAPLQDYLNTNCWGIPWVRPGLELRMRSAITLAVLVAGGKTSEIRAHTRGALRNGLSPEEIQEIFLHLAVYVGVPSAVEAFRAAQPIVAEWVAAPRDSIS